MWAPCDKRDCFLWASSHAGLAEIRWEALWDRQWDLHVSDGNRRELLNDAHFISTTVFCVQRRSLGVSPFLLPTR